VASSREIILSALRSAAPTPLPIPEPRGIGARYPDLRQQFAKAVGEVGGRCVLLSAEGVLEEALSGFSEYSQAKRVASLVAGVDKANVDLADVKDPHELHDLDVCVLLGELGVAENGAVWIREGVAGNRAGWFLAQHMVLVLPGESIVHDLHQAYERIDAKSRGFGTFISGPSKTADIEQALVIGAQGPRSCTVFVIG